MTGKTGKLARMMLMLALLPALGTLGFMTIEGWGFLDSLYMSVITLTTVGFREVHELSRAGQLFVIAYLVIGLGAFFYAIIQIGEMVVRAELGDWLGKRKMDTTLKALSNHIIVCGFGRMGRTVCRHLASKRLPFVVIDRSDEALFECQKREWPYVMGDATDDQTLIDAGIERARGIAAVLSEDADNVYVVLSARLLSKDLTVMARAADEKSVPKLRKAGADRVISLYEAGATKMAQLFGNPNLEEFAEIFAAEGSEVDLADLHVRSDSGYVGRVLSDTDFRARGVIVVGIKRKGELMLPPSSATRIETDDALILLGKSGAIADILTRHH